MVVTATNTKIAHIGNNFFVHLFAVFIFLSDLWWYKTEISGLFV